MPHARTILLFVLLSSFDCSAEGQALPACDPHEPERRPGAAETFWTSDVMQDETVLMVATAGGPARARLLWPATEILSVRDATLRREFQHGEDWQYDPRSQTLISQPGSELPSLSSEQLLVDGQPRFEENHFFHTKQLSVTYRHATTAWRGPTPEAERRLPTFYAKLHAHERVKVVVFGDSIAAGYNASGFAVPGSGPVAPFLKSWPDLVACEIGRAHGVEVDLVNTSVPGTTSSWGRQNVHELVSPQMPDLAIIAFGMNDRSAGVSDEEFLANMVGIVGDIRAANPRAELILVAPMLANPDWAGAGNPRAYIGVLAGLAKQPGVALVDMTTTHLALLETKRYVDMTGNGLNHPNDFLIRWYAQQIRGVIE